MMAFKAIGYVLGTLHFLLAMLILTQKPESNLRANIGSTATFLLFTAWWTFTAMFGGIL